MVKVTKKDKKKLKMVKDKLKKQVIELPDGSVVTLKVRPKLGNKTKATIEWDKSIDNVDFSISVSGQPIRVCQEGIHTDIAGDKYFQAEAKATYKF